jgi:S-DNA-T family DNA segregation ATPase FtsK/SpoIIIE
MVVQGRPGFTRVRTPYYEDEPVARICRETSHLTRDPMPLLEGAPRLSVVPSSEMGAAPTRGGDRSVVAAEHGLVIGERDIT